RSLRSRRCGAGVAAGPELRARNAIAVRSGGHVGHQPQHLGRRLPHCVLARSRGQSPQVGDRVPRRGRPGPRRRLAPDLIDRGQMDFALPSELAALQDEATALARGWTASTPFPEDSWIVGHDPDFAKELAARGWIGMTWPVEHGGHGRSALERFIVYEALIAH